MQRKTMNAISFIIIVFSFLLLISCGKNVQTAEELMRYHNENWDEIVNMRNSVLKGNSSQLIYIEETEGKQASRDYLEEVILSDFEDFLEAERAIEIQDDSVKKLHELLIDADEFVYDLLKDKATAYYRGDADENELFAATDESIELYDVFFDYREKLMKKNKLVFDHVINDKGSYEEKMVNKSDAKNLDGIKWGTQ